MPCLHNVAASVYELVQDEAEANTGYNKFLHDHKVSLDTEDVNTILEIMSDEVNHTLKLLAIAKKYDNVKAAPDGAHEAMREIMDGVEHQHHQ